MARSIQFSVGSKGGRNQPGDTKTVQELLNNVPLSEGGPSPRLEVDGKCGPLTKAAIQKFQLKHFGWKGADGRVDPDGPTLAKLNTFDKKPDIPVPPKPVEVVIPESTDFFIIHMSAKKVSVGGEDDLFFLVADIKNNILAVYWIDAARRGKPTVAIPQGNNWAGSGGRFQTKKARRVNDLEVPAAWFSRDDDGVVTSKLVLFFPEGGATIPMNHHLIGPGGRISPSKGGGSASTAVSGDFILIEVR
ncbi:MAG TPA: peptidoglycan-binding domain-containing protein [Bryobacteraceae bacterium]|nr:peptidoglycan-binding domain-containing protein [Bryobacteraceae bacterium]